MMAFTNLKFMGDSPHRGMVVWCHACNAATDINHDCPHKEKLMTRPERIERALREAVDFIRAHKLEQEPGLNYRARTVKIGEARLENWAGALGGAPIVGPGGSVYPVSDDAIRKLADGPPNPQAADDLRRHIISRFPFVIKHHTGCGRTALRSRKMFLEGSSVELGDLCRLDGGRVAAPMPPSTAVTHGLFGAKCGSCGGTVEVPDLLAFAHENARAGGSAHRSELHERGRPKAAPSREGLFNVFDMFRDTNDR